MYYSIACGRLIKLYTYQVLLHVSTVQRARVKLFHVVGTRSDNSRYVNPVQVVHDNYFSCFNPSSKTSDLSAAVFITAIECTWFKQFYEDI